MGIDVGKLIDSIARKRQVNQEDLAEMVGLNRTVFSRYKKQRPEELLSRLQEYFPAEVKDYKTAMGAVPDKDIKFEQATLKALITDYLKLKAQLTKRPIEEIIEDFDRDTKLIYRDL